MTQRDIQAELRAIADEVQECTKCDLHCGATRGVPGEGPADARVMLVGEGPGANEDKQGRPFVGAAGSFLNELLAAGGLKRSDVFITNVVKHRPPGNRDPLPAELAACRPYLDRQIALIDPTVIVTLGRYSLGSFFPNDKISRVHGQIREQNGRLFFNMYHPAAALHQQALRNTLLDDMKRLAEFMAGPAFAQRAQRTGANEAAPPETSGDSEQLSLF